jgi:hypothetical protein
LGSLPLSPLFLLPGHQEVGSFALPHTPHHEVLSHHRPTVLGPSDQELKPWAKTNLSSL